ncbi:Rieske 2Fe-2S domain-containing protein [Pantoea sp. 18069]|uniref:Rieske 2Fe-2S domain-containing protein n=1 Tax=Pantoea sp. 18069 TaxID=2681415 RepID=UPI00135C63CC|nr:Rieske 2Fe-2S domain-containing protein [Pantoea sp. 18069]
MNSSTRIPAKRYVELLPEKGHPSEIPFGWYFVAYSDELEFSEIRVISCFWQEWVLFRDECGSVGMIDPYCPHLGAHIGFGGKVDGEMVRCPFHAWGFDSSGYCRDVPYAKKMPPILKKGPVLKYLPVIECNKIIWAWYHPGAVAPIWNVDNFPETMSNNWIEYEKVEFEISTSIQDIVENSIDYSHLKYVHGHTSTLLGETRQDGIYRHVNIGADVQVIDREGKPDSCHYSIELIQKGPGQHTIRYRRETELLMMFLMTPVTNEKTILRFAFTHEKYPEGSYEHKSVKEFMLEKLGSHGNLNGVHADIPIWNNKIYRKKPLLCEGDGPIMPYRSWFKQFYDGGS